MIQAVTAIIPSELTVLVPVITVHEHTVCAEGFCRQSGPYHHRTCYHCTLSWHYTCYDCTCHHCNYSFILLTNGGGLSVADDGESKS